MAARPPFRCAWGSGITLLPGRLLVLADLEVLAVEAVEPKRADDSSRDGVVSRGGDGMGSMELDGVTVEGVLLGSGVKNDVSLVFFLVDLMDSGVPAALGALLGLLLGESLEGRSFLEVAIWTSEPGGRPGNS